MTSHHATHPLAGYCWGAALLLALLTTATGVESYTDLYIDGTAVEQLQHGPPQHPYLWFGPRLGRRKRTLEEVMPKSSGVDESVVREFEDPSWLPMPVPLMGYENLPRSSRTQEEWLELAKQGLIIAPRMGRRRRLLAPSPPPPSLQDRFERSASVADVTKAH